MKPEVFMPSNKVCYLPAVSAFVSQVGPASLDNGMEEMFRRGARKPCRP